MIFEFRLKYPTSFAIKVTETHFLQSDRRAGGLDLRHKVLQESKEHLGAERFGEAEYSGRNGGNRNGLTAEHVGFQ